MRVLMSIFLFIFVVALLTFILQNSRSVPLNFLGWEGNAPMAVLSLGLYFLGMLSGWTVVGFLKKSIRTIREGESRH